MATETRTFYACVDEPSLVIEDQTFVGGIAILLQPTYGRVLFRAHDTVVRRCVFLGGGAAIIIRHPEGTP